MFKYICFFNFIDDGQHSIFNVRYLMATATFEVQCTVYGAGTRFVPCAELSVDSVQLFGSRRMV